MLQKLTFNQITPSQVKSSPGVVSTCGSLIACVCVCACACACVCAIEGGLCLCRAVHSDTWRPKYLEVRAQRMKSSLSEFKKKKTCSCLNAVSEHA